jgi:hypothetical protein
MRLADSIKVNTRYTRSINIERDATAGSAQAYVLTAKARQTLCRILESLDRTEKPRSWALIGPYGAGKSAFGLFLVNLLAKGDAKVAAAARQLLRNSDGGLYAQFEAVTRNKKSLCPIILTGSPDPLSARLFQGMRAAAEGYLGRPRSDVAKELDRAAKKGTPSANELVRLLSMLQDAVARRKGGGVLLVIDELGKFLDYEARHRGSEVFLLQALAEHSVRSSQAPFIFVGLLHQSFELYASRLGDELKNEWKKVSGRFEAVPFLETADQTIRVIEAAFVRTLPKQLAARVEQESDRLASQLAKLECLPSGFARQDACRIFSRCYPLHPVSLLLLPTLCQKVAQNERTLFSYLGSHEPHGFLERLQRLVITEELPWIKPSDIYEYFILNQPGLTVDHGTHRRWAEVVTALERLGDAPSAELELIKTVGILNIIGSQSGLKASEGVLSACIGDREKLQRTIASLTRQSTITYRKYSGEYRVWQGTDFDLDAAMIEAKAQFGQADISELLNAARPISPIVARRHTIATGTLRFFAPIFVGRTSIGKVHPRKDPTMFLCVAETAEQEEDFSKKLLSLTGPSVGAIYRNGLAVCDAILEVQALRRVQRHSQELANDPVAQRELKDRLAAAQAIERQAVLSIIENPETTHWFIAGERLEVVDKRALQVRISALLNAVFNKAPLIKNELVNRDSPSSNAIAGRKKLFLAMLDRPHEKDLGIEKFPAEKAMYRSILRATKLHALQGGRWAFQAPPKGKDDIARIRPAWDAVMALLNEKDGPAISVESIYALLSREPYGIKEGILPILLVAMYQAMNKEFAMCEAGQFVPFLTQEVLEGLLKTPAAYTLQRVRTNTAQRALHSAYASVLLGQPSAQSEVSLIAMLQPLAKMIMSLPDYSRRTRRISGEAVAVRDLFLSAKTPVQLLFSDIPKACGIELAEGGDLQKQSEAFATVLKRVLNEIKVAYHALLNDVTEALRTAFGLRASLQLHEIREAIQARCQGLDVFTIDQQGLKAFLGRLSDPFGDESQWLVSVATFLARKPPEKWSDEDLQACEFRLREFVSRLNDLRQLQLHYERGKAEAGQHFEAALLRLISTEGGESQAVVTLDKRTKDFVQEKARDLVAALERLPSDEVRLATLVTLLRAYLRPQESEEEVNVPSKVA